MSEAFGVQRRLDVLDPVKGVNFIATEYSSASWQDRSSQARCHIVA